MSLLNRWLVVRDKIIELAGVDGQFSSDHAKWAASKLAIITREASQSDAEKAMKEMVFWTACFEARGWARGRHYYREYGFKTVWERDQYMRRVMGDDTLWKEVEIERAQESKTCDSN